MNKQVIVNLYIIFLKISLADLLGIASSNPAMQIAVWGLSPKIAANKSLTGSINFSKTKRASVGIFLIRSFEKHLKLISSGLMIFIRGKYLVIQ
jgi:hypothetical protein